MNEIFMPEISIIEKILRPAIVYIFLVLVFRLMGKHEVGQMTPFDFIVLLLISNIFQNAMVGADNSIGGAIAGVVIVLLLNYGFNRLAMRSRKIRNVLEGRPAVLIRDGIIDHKALKRELIDIDDLHSILRKHSIDPNEVHIVKKAVLEVNGDISIILHQHKKSR